MLLYYLFSGPLCNFTVQVLYTGFKNVKCRTSNDLNYTLVKQEGWVIGLNVINNKSQVQHIHMESCSEMIYSYLQQIAIHLMCI